MNKISIETVGGRVEGECDARFAAVCDAFVANFNERGEVGASVALTLEGRTVVDLWGGRKTRGGEAVAARHLVYDVLLDQGCDGLVRPRPGRSRAARPRCAGYGLLAGLYAPLANGGSCNGTRLLGPDTVARMGRVSMATHDDATLVMPLRFEPGYMKSVDNRRTPDTVNSSLLMGDTAFGHAGAGGSLGFADPGCRMSFGYAMNRMGTGLMMNPRGQSLIDAAYLALGYRSNSSGAWIA